MKNSRAVAAIFAIAFIIAIGAMAGRTANAAHTLPVGLGTTAPFAILAGTPNITNVPTSRITGDVGLSPATGAGIGLTCAEVTGTIYSVDAAGPLPCRVTNPGLLSTAKTDLTTAINDAAGRTGGLPVTANELAGKTLPHGVYTSAAAMNFAGGGTLILDGGGDPNAVFIFQLGTLLTVGNSTTVTLINQAQSCNVFWKVDSASIGTTATFRGTILAETSITVANGSTVDGRLLASTGNVTLISDTITRSTCAAPPPPPPPLPTCPPGATGPLVGCIATPVPATTPAATVAATATPAGATATPTSVSVASATPTVAPTSVAATAGATATPTSVSVASATPTVAPTSVAAAAATATPAVAGTQGLPSTSTADLGPLTMLGIALAGIGLLLLRGRPVRHL